MMAMKNKTRLITAILIVLLVPLALLGLASLVSNPWNARRLGDIPTPIGFHRPDAEEGSYSAFLRDIPLKKRGASVKLYTGGNANFQSLSAGVIDWPLLSNDEQCADVTMRIRAEYLWLTGRYKEISFTGVDGKKYPYRGSDTREKFEAYMKKVYGICNTSSVYKETQPRELKDVQPGDVLVYPSRKKGRYGHAVLVADVVRSKSGKIAILCVEGNTPARDAHVLRNPNLLRNPWFILNGDEDVLHLSFFTFFRQELRHY